MFDSMAQTDTYLDADGLERCDECEELTQDCGRDCPICGDTLTECACD